MNEELQQAADDKTPSPTAVDWRRLGVGFVLRAGEYYCVFLFGLLGFTSHRNLALILGALLAAIAFYIGHRFLYRGRTRKRWGWLTHFLAIVGILFFFASMLIPTPGPTRERAIYASIEADLRLMASLCGRYQELNGEYPNRLEDVADLAPKKSKRVRDPFGDTYRYRKLDDGRLVIYSLGPDGDDDGGEKEFDRRSLWYGRSSFPFNMMPRFIYDITYESKVVDIDGDIRLFVPGDYREEYERMGRAQVRANSAGPYER